MLRMRSLSWVIGIALIGGISLETPASVAQTNESSVTGTNTFNNTAPRFPTPGLSPDTIATANRLSQELASARNAYTTTEQEATRVPRRFARGPGGDCVNPALSRLNEAIRASEEFLSGLSSAQVEQLRRTSNLKIW